VAVAAEDGVVDLGVAADAGVRPDDAAFDRRLLLDWHWRPMTE
jgi:hypothetical protein